MVQGERGLGLLIAGCCALIPSTAEAQPEKPEEAADILSVQDDLKDIIVTARRRPEPLQTVPASVVALSKEDHGMRASTT